MAPTQQSAAKAGATSLVFDGVTVVDVEHGTLLPAQRVVIVGNRIRAMGDQRAVQTPDGAQVVDARGKYLIPGLWDMHTHSHRLTDFLYPLFIVNGVTGIRDANSEVPLDTVRQWRQAILAGTRVGPPRQILSGPAIFEASSGSCQETPRLRNIICVTTAEAPHIVDSLKAAGSDMLKMYILGEQLYFAIAAEARRQGIPFGGHLDPVVTDEFQLPVAETNGPGAIEASDSGVHLIDHTNTSAELSAICAGTWGNTPNVERCRNLAEHFRRNDTWWVPTLMVMRSQGVEFGERAQSVFARSDKRVRSFWSDTIHTGAPAGALTDTVETSISQASSSSSGVLSIAQSAGLRILAGTDGAPSSLLHTELELLVAEGLTPLQALQAATLNPAQFLHATDSLGTVAPGKLADVVLLDANPLVNITNTTTIRAVVANGRYFDRAALDDLFVQARAKARTANVNNP